MGKFFLIEFMYDYSVFADNSSMLVDLSQLSHFKYFNISMDAFEFKQNDVNGMSILCANIELPFTKEIFLLLLNWGNIEMFTEELYNAMEFLQIDISCIVRAIRCAKINYSPLYICQQLTHPNAHIENSVIDKLYSREDRAKFFDYFDDQKKKCILSQQFKDKFPHYSKKKDDISKYEIKKINTCSYYKNQLYKPHILNTYKLTLNDKINLRAKSVYIVEDDFVIVNDKKLDIYFPQDNFYSNINSCRDPISEGFFYRGHGCRCMNHFVIFNITEIMVADETFNIEVIYDSNVTLGALVTHKFAADNDNIKIDDKSETYILYTKY
ncbi:hypothetical protein Catovirus_1_486 [Catovirus CTV1]|uniref:Uncharacterized protein n=1 Tax=Catovirus CTV1 TaxID=1977631 RepID=A0A1V0S9P8_9VIRU|nr:hypothetical protein Catovirus_1_486 [Catovirus CTV1]